MVESVEVWGASEPVEKLVVQLQCAPCNAVYTWQLPRQDKGQ